MLLNCNIILAIGNRLNNAILAHLCWVFFVLNGGA